MCHPSGWLHKYLPAHGVKMKQIYWIVLGVRYQSVAVIDRRARPYWMNRMTLFETTRGKPVKEVAGAGVL